VILHRNARHVVAFWFAYAVAEVWFLATVGWRWWLAIHVACLATVAALAYAGGRHDIETEHARWEMEK
jgi:hypothetical protein